MGAYLDTRHDTGLGALCGYNHFDLRGHRRSSNVESFVPRFSLVIHRASTGLIADFPLGISEKGEDGMSIDLAPQTSDIDPEQLQSWAGDPGGEHVHADGRPANGSEVSQVQHAGGRKR